VATGTEETGSDRPRAEGPYSEHAKTLVRLVWGGVRGSRGATRAEVLSVAAEPTDLRDVYRKVAPATVLVKTPTGYGTGVIVTPDGKILTNFHVVRGAAVVDFVETVVIRLGRLNATTGAMELLPEVYEAEVWKTDPGADLALVKMKAPPAGLPYRPLAGVAPTPGMSVAAIGHASVGFLWAIKGGNVAAIGRLAEYSALLVGSSCDGSRAGPYEHCDERARALVQARAQLDASNTGVLIQSTVPIGRGDSGGPLVSMAGDLVGLTVLKRGDSDQAQYHVAWSTVTEFLADLSAPVAKRYPDPWAAADNVALADIDEDGLPDLLVSSAAWSSFWTDFQSMQLDLDQDSFAGMERVPRVADVFTSRSYDAELTLVRTGGSLAILYDTDGDRRMDLLLMGRDGLSEDGLPTAGGVEAAYVPGPDGGWARAPDRDEGGWIRPALFAAPLRERLLATARILEEE